VGGLALHQLGHLSTPAHNSKTACLSLCTGSITQAVTAVSLPTGPCRYKEILHTQGLQASRLLFHGLILIILFVHQIKYTLVLSI
jgi:hypothetical protein